MENDSAFRHASRWPRRLAILALALLFAGAGFFAIGWAGFEWTERRARAHPANRAEIAGHGETLLEGPSSWTVVYRGPDARQILADTLEPMVQPPITLTIEPVIEGESALVEPPRHHRRIADHEAAIAWLHLGRGTHRVVVSHRDDHEAAGVSTVAFERWRRHPAAFWPLLLIVFVALPCWLLSLAAGITAGVWPLALRGFRDRGESRGDTALPQPEPRPHAVG